MLKLDKHCEDAMFELARVRVQQLEVKSDTQEVLSGVLWGVFSWEGGGGGGCNLLFLELCEDKTFLVEFQF